MVKQYKLVFDPDKNVKRQLFSVLCLHRNCSACDSVIKLCCRHKTTEITKKQEEKMRQKLEKITKRKNKMINYTSISKPEICGVLTSTKDINYRNKVKIDQSTGKDKENVYRKS